MEILALIRQSFQAPAQSLESNSETSSEVIDVVTASTEDIRTDDDSSNLSTRDDIDDDSVSEAAKVKANALLERVTTTASTSMKVEDEVDDEFQPYELLLCFNSMPSDEAKQYLVDCIYTLKSKYRVDIELKSQELDLY